MFCAWCHEETATTPCTACGHAPLLEGRYRLEHPLGRGAMGVTWAATRLEDGALVAIKAVPLPPGLGAKERELVAREVEVLRQIHHPAVPELLDAFVVQGGAGVRVQHLVLEFVPGRTLDEELRERRLTEDDVLAVLESLLPILAHLHGLSPPVVHRDIKPKNLMRRPDGTIALIDFGAVKDALSDPRLGGSTVAGTFGYMAPEQFAGDASPQSDLYAVGAVAVALLSRKEPREMLDGAGRLRWDDHLHVSDGTRALLRDLLASDPKARPPSALAALQRVEDLRREAVDLVVSALPGRASAPAPPARRYEPPPAPRSAAPPASEGVVSVVFVAAALLAALFAGGLVTLLRPAPPPEISRDARPVQCAEGPCQPLSAFAVRGLHLGQTEEEARAAFPELADAVPGEPARVTVDPGSAIDVDAILRASRHSQTVPGTVLRVRTLIADTPADCDLSFAVADTLSRVSCELGVRSVSEANAAADRIFDALAGRHGPPTHVPDRSGLGWEHRWTWGDGTGKIELTRTGSELSGITMASLTLEADTLGHEAVVREARQRARREMEAEAAEEQGRASEARQREIEALKQRTGATDGGL